MRSCTQHAHSAGACARERPCARERRQKRDAGMRSDAVMARDLLASGSRKLFTEGPPPLAPAIITLSDEV